MDLIKVNHSQNGMTVNARELHEFLEVGRVFAAWIHERVEKYGFIEGMDFFPKAEKTSDGGRPRIEYELTIDMAKELCMVENNEKGRQARKYFIECERRYKQNALPQMTSAEMIAAIANQAVEQERRIVALETGLTTVKETFLKRDENWRNSINHMLNSVAFRSGGIYSDLRNKSYNILEERGRCNLNIRLSNLKDRLEESGATKTKLKLTTKLDVIESDPRLKEIYTTVVKELSIGSIKLA